MTETPNSLARTPHMGAHLPGRTALSPDRPTTPRRGEVRWIAPLRLGSGLDEHLEALAGGHVSVAGRDAVEMGRGVEDRAWFDGAVGDCPTSSYAAWGRCRRGTISWAKPPTTR